MLLVRLCQRATIQRFEKEFSRKRFISLSPKLNNIFHYRLSNPLREWRWKASLSVSLLLLPWVDQIPMFPLSRLPLRMPQVLRQQWPTRLLLLVLACLVLACHLHLHMLRTLLSQRLLPQGMKLWSQRQHQLLAKAIQRSLHPLLPACTWPNLQRFLLLAVQVQPLRWNRHLIRRHQSER